MDIELDKEQDVDLTVVDSKDRSEADKKISQIEDILAEEWLTDDPALIDALHEAVHAAVKGEIVDVDLK